MCSPLIRLHVLFCLALPPKFLTQNCPETKSFVPPTIDAKMKFYMSTKLVGTVNQQHW